MLEVPHHPPCDFWHIRSRSWRRQLYDRRV